MQECHMYDYGIIIGLYLKSKKFYKIKIMEIKESKIKNTIIS